VLNPTNGSSYWLTQVQSQQIASSALRAVESGRWVIQAAPTGFSAIIDPDGVVQQRSGGVVAVCTVELHAAQHGMPAPSHAHRLAAWARSRRTVVAVDSDTGPCAERLNHERLGKSHPRSSTTTWQRSSQPAARSGTISGRPGLPSTSHQPTCSACSPALVTAHRVNVTPDVPASVPTGSDPFDAKFDFVVTLPPSLVSPLQTVLGKTSLKVTNATFAVNASGAATTTLSSTTPEINLALGGTVIVNQSITGTVTPRALNDHPACRFRPWSCIGRQANIGTTR
jgi:hypothetical protein